MEIKKLKRDGRVAVLYSPNFGAGWSTWFISDQHQRLSMLFDPQIADIVDRGGPDWATQVETIARIKYPDSYLGGLSDLRVAWLPEGTVFRVHEYDGSEIIQLREEMEWLQA